MWFCALCVLKRFPEAVTVSVDRNDIGRVEGEKTVDDVTTL